MILTLALLTFLGLLALLVHLFGDVRKFVVSAFRRKKSVSSFYDYGQVWITYLVVFGLAILGVLFYKMIGAGFAHLLSDDISSFFIMARGVYSVHSPQQNPFLITHLLSGLLLAPALQFVSIFLIVKGLRTFMFRMNQRLSTDIYSESDVLRFGFLATIVFVLIETILYTQNISVVSGTANLVYLALSKLGCICFFLSTGHLNLLYKKEYRTSLSRYLELSADSEALVYKPRKIIISTYLVAVLLHAPFYSGVQFMHNNIALLLLFVSICTAFYLFLKKWLYKKYDYLGFVMLSEQPTPVLHAGLSFLSINARKWIVRIFLSSLFLLVLLKFRYVIVFVGLGLVLAFGFGLLLILVYFLGFGLGVLKARKSGHEVPSVSLNGLKIYGLKVGEIMARSYVALVAAVLLVFCLFTFFPKPIAFQNENFVNALLDKEGNLLAVEASDGNPCIPVASEDFPSFMIKCLVLQEDRSFFDQDNFFPNKWHKTSNWHGISFAMFYRGFLNGGGGSNLNTQLLKNMTGAKRDAQRKFVETIAAYQMSINHAPEEILSYYLNTVSFAGGRGHSGAMNASLSIFGKPVQALNELEMLYLTTTLTHSSTINLGVEKVAYKDAAKHPDFIKAGLLKKAALWKKEGALSKLEFNLLRSQHLSFISENPFEQPLTSRAFFKKTLKKEGDQIHAAIATVSQSAQIALGNGVRMFNDKFKKQLVKESFQLMSAVLVVEVNSGKILAHHGGNGTADLVSFSSGNQVGSVIKPFILLELLETGISPGQVKLFDGKKGKEPTPKNYSRKYSNRYVGIETTLSKSLNAAMVNVRHLHEPLPLFQRTEAKFLEMGINSDRSLDLNDEKRAREYELNYPLGSRRMTLFGIAQAYQTLLNDGANFPLTLVEQGFNGTTLKTKKASYLASQLYRKENAKYIKNALKATLKRGGTGEHFASILPTNKTFYAKTGTSEGAVHGYTVLSDGEVLIVSYVTYARAENGRLEMNNTPPIPYESGGRTAGVLAAYVYNALEKKSHGIPKREKTILAAKNKK